MGSLIRKTSIERHIITRDGQLDVHLTIDLNLFLNSKGEFSIDAAQRTSKEDDELKYEIPDLEVGDEIIEFGNEDNE
jgi:hypothetical protein